MIEPDVIKMPDIPAGRSLLREFREADLPAFFALYSDLASSLLDDWEPLRDMEGAREKMDRYRNLAREKSGTVYAIADGGTNAFIGCAGLFDFDYRSSNCGIFFQVLPSRRNAGCATEAAKALTRYGFETLGLHRIYAYVTPGNDPSVRVLEKCGYRREGLLRDMEFYKGRYWDGIAYAMIEKDYRDEALSGERRGGA